MLDRAGLFLISLFMVVVSLGVAVWLAATGQAAYLDGLFLLLCCLVVALAFGVYIGLLIRRALEELRAQPAAAKPAAAAAASAKPAGKPAMAEAEKAG